MFVLNEDSRNSLMAKSKQGKAEKDGKTRFQKRLKSHVATSTKQFNRIDMNQLFKQDILTVSVEVKGETDSYLVSMSYGGFLSELHSEIDRHNGQLELRNIVRALVIAFNKADVYLKCTCPDWKYRFNYWATKNNITFGEPELRPSDETNPDDTLGPACKHVLLVLSNTSWLIKVASVINNYIKYMEVHMKKAYADIIYPAVFGKKYEEPVQQSVFDKDELDTDEATIDKSNEEGRVRGQFKSGNKYRYTKQEKVSKDQSTIFDLDTDSDEENIGDIESDE